MKFGVSIDEDYPVFYIEKDAPESYSYTIDISQDEYQGYLLALRQWREIQKWLDEKTNAKGGGDVSVS
jgi:hypothetical protein